MAYGYNANQVNLPNPANNLQNNQPLFPPPQGNVYNINSTLEVANVPVGAGMSIALCLPENVMYIKTMQNGNPMFYPYKLVPFTNNAQDNRQESKVENKENVKEQIPNFNEKIEKIENKLKSLEEEFAKVKKKECEFNI